MKSTILVIVLFPLILPIWRERPLTAENTRRPESPTFLSQEEINSQARLYEELIDPRIRSGVCGTLALANNAHSVRALENFLAFEKNQFAIADVLRAIYNYKGRVGIAKTPLYKGLFSHSNDEVRALAAALYFDKTGAAAALIDLLENETSEYVLNFLAAELADQAWRCDRKTLEKWIEQDEPRRRALAVFMLTLGKTDPDQVPELKKVAVGGDESARMALCEALTRRKDGGLELALALVSDERVAIRTKIATSPPTKGRVELFLSLVDDDDWEARRLACLALGNYPTEKSIATLLEKLKDPSEPVRIAAEDALIKIKPGSATIERLRDLLTHPVAFDSAVRILGALDVRKAADAIHGVLKKARRPKTKKRCAEALGKLDCKEAWRTVDALAEDESAEVRKAVATALGAFAVDDSFATLVDLINDKNLAVSLEGLRMVGVIADPYFNDALYMVAKNLGGHSDKRAAACWALARINQPDSRILKWLQALSLKRVIRIQGGENMFDDDQTRISACLALVEMGRKHQNVMKTAADVANKLQSPPMFSSDFNNPKLRDYARQAYLYLKGEEIKPRRVPRVKPRFVVEPVEKKDPNYRSSGSKVPGI